MVIGIDASRIAEQNKTGTENYSVNIIRAVLALDKKNRYTLYFNKAPTFFEISHVNVSTKVISAPRFWTQGRLAFECIAHPPDILFVPAHTIPVVRRPSLKTIVTVHDLGAEFLAEYHQFPQKIYLSWSTKYVANYATHIISVSNFTKQELNKTLKVPKSRISVVHEGMDRGLFYPRGKSEIDQVKMKYGIPSQYFIFVGTIQPRKNITRLIEAFSKAKLKNTYLILVGKPGWLTNEIYEAPNKFSISKYIRFLNYIDNEDLAALYSGALGLAFPSLYEGFGLPILEAFACGCPVITSKYGAMAEVAGYAGLLVEPEDTNDIAAALKKICTSSLLREKLTQKGNLRAGDFGWEKAAAETIKVFEKVYSENAK